MENTDPIWSLRTQFNYDPTQPLGIEERLTQIKDEVSLLDLSYTSPTLGKLKAYWVSPFAKEPSASVLFVHPGPGNRDSFLEEAILLARRGMASLLIEAPWSEPEVWGPAMGEAEHDKEAFTQLVIDLRREVDVIETRAGVPGKPTLYVGHSYGALFGGILAAVENRISALVLMAGVGSFGDVATANIPLLKGDKLDQYCSVVKPLDPIRYVPHAAPSQLFFQLSKHDDFPHDKLEKYAQAGSEPKLIRWYEADHYSLNPVGREDRIEWLSGLFN